MIRGFSVSLRTGLTLFSCVKAAVWKTWEKATTVLHGLASGLCGQPSSFCLHKRAAQALNCLPSDRKISVIQRQFLFGLLPSAFPKTADSRYDWEPAGRRVTVNGLLLLHCWWQKLCPFRFPMQLHFVSGRPLPLKDLLFWNCQEMNC